MKNLIRKILRSALAIIMGMLIVLFLIEIALRVFGWWEVNKLYFSIKREKISHELVVLALGDSMTALGGKDSYPSQLEKILNDSKKISKKVRVVNGGVVHTNSSDILFSIKNHISNYNPDLILIMTGINDFGNVLYEKDAGIYADNFWNTFKVIKLLRFGEYIIQKKYLKDFSWNFSSIRDTILLKIGESHVKNENWREGLRYFEKVISINPKNHRAYQLLGFHGYKIYSLDQRKRFCEKAISIAPEDEQNYFCLGEVYFYQKKFDEQIEVYKKRLEKKPNYSPYIFEIAKFYFRNNNYVEAEKLLLSIVDRDDNLAIKNKILEILRFIYEKDGRQEEIRLLNKKIADASYRTNKNLNEIYKIVQKNKIPQVLIQYPRRDVEILKMLVPNSSHTYFVDNKDSFNSLVEQYGFDKVFIDAFAGDFGHGSSLGNKIIAENVAKVIFEQVLKNEKFN